uniref:Lipocalin/cytosolic fatty-acid binding domain-containing protein n=1 Tax=Graphocephala atropunctata TaxID=36148 RepID=A0A1B6KQY5_9HEMI
MRSYFFGAALLFVCGAHGDQSSSKCSEVEVQQDFSVSDYMGTWYTQAASNDINDLSDCTQMTLDYDHDSDVVNMVEEFIANGVPHTVKGIAVMADRHKDEGKLNATFDNAVLEQMPIPYWIVETDYDSYSVVYTCVSFLGLFKYSSIMLLSRDQEFDSEQEPKLIDRVNYLMARNAINLPPLTRIDQTQCDLLYV